MENNFNTKYFVEKNNDTMVIVYIRHTMAIYYMQKNKNRTTEQKKKINIMKKVILKRRPKYRDLKVPLCKIRKLNKK